MRPSYHCLANKVLHTVRGSDGDCAAYVALIALLLGECAQPHTLLRTESCTLLAFTVLGSSTLPLLTVRCHCSNADDIYREDIVFKDPRNTFCGMKNYKTIFWSLRFHGNLFFKQLYVEVKRIWQKTDDTICLRWTVHGLPRLPWDTEGTFDGVSTYKLDRHGKVHSILLRFASMYVLMMFDVLHINPHLLTMEDLRGSFSVHSRSSFYDTVEQDCATTGFSISVCA